MRNTGNYIVDSDITKENIDRTNRNKYMNWRYEGELGNAAILNSFVYDLYYAMDTMLWDIYANMRITKSAITTADQSTLALLNYYDSLIEENMEDIINGDTPEYDNDDEDYEEKLEEMPDAEGIKDGIKDIIDDTDNEEQKKARDAARERAEAAKKAAEEAANKAKEASQRAEAAKKAAEDAAKKAEAAMAAEKPHIDAGKDEIKITLTDRTTMGGATLSDRIKEIIEDIRIALPSGKDNVKDRIEVEEIISNKAREEALKAAEEVLKNGGSTKEATGVYIRTYDEKTKDVSSTVSSGRKDSNINDIQTKDMDAIKQAAEELEKQAEEQAKANAEASAAQQAAKEAEEAAAQAQVEAEQADIESQLAQQEAETYDPGAGCDDTCDGSCDHPVCDCDCDVCDCVVGPCDVNPCDCDNECHGGDVCDMCSGDGACNDCCVGDGGCAHGDATCDCCVNDCCVNDCVDCDSCDSIGCPTDFCFGGDI